MNRASRQSVVLLFVAACSRSTPTATATEPPTATATATASAPAPATATASPLVAARPYASFAPRSYSASTPAPLVLVLHGYGGNGRWQVDHFHMLDAAEAHGFLVAFPDGTLDHEGNRFWNATDACCDFDRKRPDDVAYLAAVIDDMRARFAIDPARIYVTGLSNGGFMAHRLACDLSPRIAAIVSLAGAQWRDASRCKPSGPVAIVEAHEDDDPIIRPMGGTVFSRSDVAPYPPVTETVATWAKKNGCTGALVRAGAPLDLNARVGGADTHVARYAGCPAGGEVELWTIRGGAHAPTLEPAWAETVWSFFASHPKRS